MNSVLRGCAPMLPNAALVALADPTCQWLIGPSCSNTILACRSCGRAWLSSSSPSISRGLSAKHSQPCSTSLPNRSSSCERLNSQRRSRPSLSWSSASGCRNGDMTITVSAFGHDSSGDCPGCSGKVLKALKPSGLSQVTLASSLASNASSLRKSSASGINDLSSATSPWLSSLRALVSSPSKATARSQLRSKVRLRDITSSR
ncbi:hypothetical protein D3C81_985050 [compost metagenome]